MYKKYFIGIASGFIVSLLVIAPALAHVIVTPHLVGVAATQEFSMAVPTEKDNPTVGIRLVIPNGLSSVIPNAKQGWSITEKKNGTGDNATVEEINWTGGSILPGQRDNFLFQAQVPSKATTLKWKAYQTYQDGSVIAWDHNPTNNPNDDSAPPPYSQTKVVNDLSGNSITNSSRVDASNIEFADWLAVVAVLLSASAIYLSWSKSKTG